MAITYPGPSVATYFTTLGVGVTQGTTTFSWLKTADPLFVVVTVTDGTYTTSGVTFDGVSMTESYNFTGATSGRYYQFFTLKTNLVTKAAGTYNVVVTNSASNKGVDAFLVQYSGVQDDFSSRSSGQVTFSASPITFSHTTVATDSWIFLFGRFSASLRTGNGSTDGSFRMSSASSRFIVDSGANEGSAGSKSVNVTSASGALGVVEYIAIEFKKNTSMSLSVTDAATATESPTKNATIPKQDTALFADTKRLSLTKTVLDVGSFIEALAYEVSRIFTDSSTFVDAISKIFTKAVSESASFIDSLGPKTLVKRVTELITFSDSPALNGVWIDRTEPAASWTDRSEPVSSWTDRTEPSTSWSDRTEPSAAWTDRTKPTTSWS